MPSTLSSPRALEMETARTSGRLVEKG
jgi:hypothetical protein